MREPLPALEVIKAIEHRFPDRVPMMIHFWTHAGNFGDREDQVRAILDEYPNDMYVASPRMPAQWDDRSDPGHIPGYSWLNTPPPPPSTTARGHDAQVAIEDWSQLDDILAAWPDAHLPQMFEGVKADMEANAAGRYRLMTWWFCFYERLWSLRGMENILCDFYTDPEPLCRLMDALTDFYCEVIRRAGKEVNANGIFTSDDIGMQTGPMFGPEIFRKFFKPRYKKLIDTAHEQNLHFWLHTCGNVSPFLEDFIEIGLDVVHPIQKYTMDEREVADRFGGRIAFWAGMDVQQILPRGTEQQVRDEVRFMIDTYDSPTGGCMITVGNATTADVPVDNLRAFCDEAYEYGIRHRREFINSGG